MKTEDESFLSGIALGTVITIVIMVVVCVTLLRGLKSQAIDRGLAYYHPQTAEFTWVEENPNAN